MCGARVTEPQELSTTSTPPCRPPPPPTIVQYIQYLEGEEESAARRRSRRELGEQDLGLQRKREVVAAAVETRVVTERPIHREATAYSRPVFHATLAGGGGWGVGRRDEGR